MMYGVVTLYNPPATVLVNIDTYIGYLEKLFVVDNTPGGSGELVLELQKRHAKVILLSSGSNLGIAQSMNLALAQAWGEGAAWLLTMDQDSRFDASWASGYFDSINSVDQEQVAILSPSHKRTQHDSLPCRFEEKTVVWTSGNLLNLNLIKHVGRFDERLFIDSIDHEFCFRVRRAGYKVLQSVNCRLEHELGEKLTGSMLFGLVRKRIEIHSPKRLYFIIRNALYLSKWYGNEFPAFMGKLRKNTIKELLDALCYGRARVEYAKYAMRAVRDYRNNVYGNSVNL
jgi:rhamnosyltransferase